jgi:hypothetical protein
MPLPKDSNGASIQVLSPGTSIVLNPNAGSVNDAISSPTGVLYISVTGDVWIKFGVGAPIAAAAAGNIYIPGPGILFMHIPSINGVLATHIAAYAAGPETVCVLPLQ